MILKNPKEYKLIGFEKSKTKTKKYDAILSNKTNGSNKRIPFGDIRYQQFEDKTPLGIYSHLNHKDPIRRKSYLARHKNDINNKFSSGYFSSKYLW